MATLIRFDDRVIAFRKIADERLNGLLATGIGILFAGIAFPMLIPMRSWSAGSLLVVAVAVTGSALVGFAFVPLFKSERLVVDLMRKKYKCRRGVFFWGERRRGPLSDFDQIRLALIPDHEDYPHWAVEFVWQDDEHQPFRVHHWRRARSFTLARPGTEQDQRSFLSDLKRMAKALGVQFVVPKEYYGNQGLLDADDDL